MFTRPTSRLSTFVPHISPKHAHVRYFCTNRCINFARKIDPVNIEVFGTISDLVTKQKIFEVCQKEEECESRQKILYDEYVQNIMVSSDGNTVMLKNLCQKYNIMPNDIMAYLYNHAMIVTKTETSNPFNLPDSREVCSASYDPPNSLVKWSEVYRSLMNRYKADISKDRFLNLERSFVETYKYIVLKKGDTYDYAQLELKSDNEDTVITEKNHDASIEIVFVEKKRPGRHFGSVGLECVFEQMKLSGHYVDQIGTITLKMTFDGSNIYNVSGYESVYGKNAFHRAIISVIDNRIKFTGELSIRYQRFVDTIHDTVTRVCGENNELKTKIQNDFVDLTTHSHDDTKIEIGELMDRYNIESHELLYVMYTSNMPFGAGVFAYAANRQEADTFTLEKAKQTLTDRNYYVDYLHGKPIKNIFRKKHGDTQSIRIQKYDSRTRYGNFYACIVWLMSHKLSQPALENYL